MGPLLDALGIYCVMLEDPLATTQNRIRPRNGSARTTYTHLTITNRKWAQIQKLGRQARWQRLSKEQRPELMRALALKRWRKTGP